jgi:hypothetical protein
MILLILLKEINVSVKEPVKNRGDIFILEMSEIYSLRKYYSDLKKDYKNEYHKSYPYEDYYYKLFDDKDVYSFCIFINPRVFSKKLLSLQKKIESITKIVEREKPAHTLAKVLILPDYLKLGGFNYLGVNSQLPNKYNVTNKSRVGITSQLSIVYESGAVGIKSRIAIDTLIS